MKISKIPGLGRFGVFIDDVDFDHITNEEWMEIGKLHLESLVTIIRNTKLDKSKYYDLMYQWGTSRGVVNVNIYEKYNIKSGKEFYERCFADDPSIDPADREWGKNLRRLQENDANGNGTAMMRVTGKRDADGNPIGMFAEGELLWHSNESAQLAFTPGVSLLGQENMTNSCTGFVTTTDWYEAQSESFRSELDEMIVVHNYRPGSITPGIEDEQDLIVYRNMCPDGGAELPMVINSPGGITGLHYSVNTVEYIKGMSKSESQKIFDIINKGIFTEENIYDHWYQHNDDLCLFDNSICLHRRLGETKNRLALRIQYDYETLTDEPYQPYRQEPFKSMYVEDITRQINFIGDLKSRFKLPKLEAEA